MAATSYIPERGDIVWLTFSPQAGHEQAGRRPALVLSPRTYNAATSLMIACPVTSHQKGYPFEVALSQGASIQGVVLADHVKSFDWRARNIAFIETVSDAVVKEVAEHLARLLP
jgi:mRNA interferase MazF